MTCEIRAQVAIVHLPPFKTATAVSYVKQEHAVPLLYILIRF